MSQRGRAALWVNVEWVNVEWVNVEWVNVEERPFRAAYLALNECGL